MHLLLRKAGAAATLMIATGLSLALVAQNRDFHTETVVIDDNNGNTIRIETLGTLGGSGTVSVPLPGSGSTQFILTNISGGQTIETPLTIDDTLILASVGGNAPVFRIEAPGGASYTAIRTQSQSGNVILTLPPDDGTSGQVLYTDGSGGLFWTTLAADTTYPTIGSTVFADKTSATTRSAGVDGTTVLDDPDLTVPLNANQDYQIDFVVYSASSQSNVDLYLALGIPTGATLTAHYASFDHHTNLQGNELLTADATPSTTAIQVPAYSSFPPPNDCAIIIGHGIVRVGGTSGTLDVMWAPAGGGVGIMVGADSYLKVTRMN